MAKLAYRHTPIVTSSPLGEWHTATLASGHTPIAISSPWEEWHMATQAYGHTSIAISSPWGEWHTTTLALGHTPIVISSLWGEGTCIMQRLLAQKANILTNHYTNGNIYLPVFESSPPIRLQLEWFTHGDLPLFNFLSVPNTQKQNK